MIIDRPHRADLTWLETIQSPWSASERATITHTGERGMVSEMHIAGEGLQCLTRFDHSLLHLIGRLLKGPFPDDKKKPPLAILSFSSSVVSESLVRLRRTEEPFCPE
jgi:hypothetical protein